MFILEIINSEHYKYQYLDLASLSMNISVIHAIKILLLVYVLVVQHVKVLNYVISNYIKVKNVTLIDLDMKDLILLNPIDIIMNFKQCLNH